MNAITILESYENANPVIGTVLCKGHSKKNIQERIEQALLAHFNADEVLSIDIPWADIEKFRIEPFNVKLHQDGEETEQTIEIHITEIY